jgi:hypothetical protein
MGAHVVQFAWHQNLRCHGRQLQCSQRLSHARQCIAPTSRPSSSAVNLNALGTTTWKRCNFSEMSSELTPILQGLQQSKSNNSPARLLQLGNEHGLQLTAEQVRPGLASFICRMAPVRQRCKKCLCTQASTVDCLHSLIESCRSSVLWQRQSCQSYLQRRQRPLLQWRFNSAQQMCTGADLQNCGAA